MSKLWQVETKHRIPCGSAPKALETSNRFELGSQETGDTIAYLLPCHARVFARIIFPPKKEGSSVGLSGPLQKPY